MTCPLDKKVKTTKQWKAEHQPHMPPGKDFTIKPFNHPVERWHWIVCVCGA